VAEYLFRSPDLLTSAITAALSDRVHRPDDIEFVIAARGWSECVTFGNFELYNRRFEETAGKPPSLNKKKEGFGSSSLGFERQDGEGRMIIEESGLSGNAEMADNDHPYTIR
jgi:hypothetical protein